MHIYVCLNQRPNGLAMLYGYKPEDALNAVYSFNCDFDETWVNTDSDHIPSESGLLPFETSVLEHCFELFNSYPGERELSAEEANWVSQYRAQEHRSLSVGDVVIISRELGIRAYACDRVGWRKLTDEPRVIQSLMR